MRRSRWPEARPDGMTAAPAVEFGHGLDPISIRRLEGIELCIATEESKQSGNSGLIGCGWWRTYPRQGIVKIGSEEIDQQSMRRVNVGQGTHYGVGNVGQLQQARANRMGVEGVHEQPDACGRGQARAAGDGQQTFA
jgi:hypothetical protein